MTEIIETQIKTIPQELDFWIGAKIDDYDALSLYQRVEYSFDQFSNFLQNLKGEGSSDDDIYLKYAWALECRDFALMLRDSLLSVVKHEQFVNDGRNVPPNFVSSVRDSVAIASGELKHMFHNRYLSPKIKKQFLLQKDPIPFIVDQIDELSKQTKKISRSSVKVDSIRNELSEFQKDFNVQFQRQLNLVYQTSDSIKEVKRIVDSIGSNAKGQDIKNAIEEINVEFTKLESYRGIDSIEVLSYTNMSAINIPVFAENGQLFFKNINVSSEFSRWFSSRIYPLAIELETKRNQTIDKGLGLVNRVRSRLAGLILMEKESYNVSDAGVKQMLTEFINSDLKSLLKEEIDINQKVSSEMADNIYASAIYNKTHSFLPGGDSAQIGNMSRDAIVRMLKLYKKYKSNVLEFSYNRLSRYIQMEATSSGKFIANKLLIDASDEKLSLLLKKGYLGRSFTVDRPNLIGKISNAHTLWKRGIFGSVLIYGGNGFGKSTVMGMLSSDDMNSEIIHIRAGEVTFVKHLVIDPSFDLGSVLDDINKYTYGNDIIVNIDDLEHWHDKEFTLYDNINALVQKISKYKKRMFFIVSSGHYLRERIAAFKDLSTIFSTQIEIGAMSKANMKKALLLREKALPDGAIKPGKEVNISRVVSASHGNIGQAMYNYCRMLNDNFDINMKSHEFGSLIKKYGLFLEYVISNHTISIDDLRTILEESDFKDTLKSIDQLTALNILVRPKDGIIMVNPFLIHNIEREINHKN